MVCENVRINLLRTGLNRAKPGSVVRSGSIEGVGRDLHDDLGLTVATLTGCSPCTYLMPHAYSFPFVNPSPRHSYAT